MFVCDSCILLISDVWFSVLEKIVVFLFVSVVIVVRFVM